MENTKICKVVIKTDNCDILSADTDFYAFVGSRLYHTFERLVCEEDRAVLRQKIQERSGERFLLRITSEEGCAVSFFVQIFPCESEGRVRLELIQTEHVLSLEHRLRQELKIKNTILELYNDYYFIYQVQVNLIQICYMNRFEQEIFSGTLAELKTNMQRNTSSENQDFINEFLAALQQGERDLELNMVGGIWGEEDDSVTTTIQGHSIYEEGVYVMAAGYIHQGALQSHNIHKKVEHDSLTGLLAKAEITNAVIKTIDVAKKKNVCIAIVDIDYFKKVNDNYGHMTGDEVLTKVASIMEDEVGSSGIVGRIGGDEFMIMFYDVYDMELTRERLRSIKNIVNSTYPPDIEGKPAITLSIGCASYPKDADNYEDLFVLADRALYRAKEKGRNRYIIYDIAKHGSLEDIRNTRISDDRLNSRGNMSDGDIVCLLMSRVYDDSGYTLENLLDDVSVNLSIQRILVYSKNPCEIVAMAGEKRPSPSIIAATKDYILNEELQQFYDQNGVMIIDNVDFFSERIDKDVYNKLRKQDVLSLIHLRFLDKNGNPGILSLESVNKRITWNHSVMNINFYRLLARLLSEYEIQ